MISWCPSPGKLKGTRTGSGEFRLHLVEGSLELGLVDMTRERGVTDRETCKEDG